MIFLCPVVGPRAIDGRVFSLIFQPGGGGVWGGGGGISDPQRSCLSSVLVQMYLSEDARLALGLVLIVRCAGASPLFRCHPILDPVFAVCPEYLDSLFDVVTQTPDPCLSLVAEIVLLPHRFPLAFDSLGLCLPVLWSAYCSVLRRSACFPPSRLVSLSSCLHVVANRLLGARLLAVLPVRGPAMAAQPDDACAGPSSVRSAGRSRTPPLARSRDPCLPSRTPPDGCSQPVEENVFPGLLQGDTSEGCGKMVVASVCRIDIF